MSPRHAPSRINALSSSPHVTDWDETLSDVLVALGHAKGGKGPVVTVAHSPRIAITPVLCPECGSPETMRTSHAWGYLCRDCDHVWNEPTH
jgi:hypothetical protein